MIDIKKLAYKWITWDSKKVDVESDYYCQTRNVFEARNDKMLDFLIKKGIGENKASLIYAIAGELGNNSFDHNLGNWPNIMGVFFGYDCNGENGEITIADRGLGVLETLKEALPNLNNHKDALELAFTKKISSRILENRGNGLKFIRKNVINKNFYLEFWSGDAKATISQEMKIGLTDSFINGCIANLSF